MKEDDDEWFLFNILPTECAKLHGLFSWVIPVGHSSGSNPLVILVAHSLGSNFWVEFVEH